MNQYARTSSNLELLVSTLDVELAPSRVRPLTIAKKDVEKGEREPLHHRRIRLLNAITRIIDAANEAMNLALEIEAEDEEIASHELPPNVIRDEEKTGPRLPFKTDTPPPTASSRSALHRRVTQYAFSAFNGERALHHLKKAYDEQTDEPGRQRIIGFMEKLAAEGMFTTDDISEYLAKKKP